MRAVSVKKHDPVSSSQRLKKLDRVRTHLKRSGILSFFSSFKKTAMIFPDHAGFS